MTDFYSRNRCVCSTRSHGPLLCAFCLSFHFKIMHITTDKKNVNDQLTVHHWEFHRKIAIKVNKKKKNCIHFSYQIFDSSIADTLHVMIHSIPKINERQMTE